MAVSSAGITVSSVTLFIIMWTAFGAEHKGLALPEQRSTKTQTELTLMEIQFYPEFSYAYTKTLIHTQANIPINWL